MLQRSQKLSTMVQKRCGNHLQNFPCHCCINFENVCSHYEENILNIQKHTNNLFSIFEGVMVKDEGSHLLLLALFSHVNSDLQVSQRLCISDWIFLKKSQGSWISDWKILEVSQGSWISDWIILKVSQGLCIRNWIIWKVSQ